MLAVSEYKSGHAHVAWSDGIVSKYEAFAMLHQSVSINAM